MNTYHFNPKPFQRLIFKAQGRSKLSSLAYLEIKTIWIYLKLR